MSANILPTNEASLQSTLALHDAFFCRLSSMVLFSSNKHKTNKKTLIDGGGPGGGSGGGVSTVQRVDKDKKSQLSETSLPSNNNRDTMGKKRKKKDTMEQDSSKVVTKRARKQVERPLSQDPVQVKKDRHNNMSIEEHKEDTKSTNKDLSEIHSHVQVGMSLSSLQVNPPPPPPLSEPSSAKVSHIESLREKLLKKIESLRVQRQQNQNGEMTSTGTQPTQINLTSKRAARKQLKEQRRQLAVIKNKTMDQTPTTSTSKSLVKPYVDNTTLLRRLSQDNHSFSSPTMNTAATTTTTTTKIKDDLSGIDFGAFTGLASSHNTSISDNKSISNLGKKKSLESLLSEAEKKKARLKELKESEQVEDQQKASQIEWKETLLIASGVKKSRDSDPALLKKAIKRKVKKKVKSEEGWKTRLNQRKEHMNQRQQIRSHNVQMRKIGGSVGANLSKKQIQSEDSSGTMDNKGKLKKQQENKKHLNRPGFEGKRNHFINHGKK